MKNKLPPPPIALIKSFKNLVKGYGGVRPTAKALGYSPAYISGICNGHHPLPNDLANKVGWQYEPRWVKLS